MLTLKRRAGEAIIIYLENGEQIRVEIHDVRRINVTVSVDAPKHIKILRSEIANEEEPIGHLWKGDQ